MDYLLIEIMNKFTCYKIKAILFFISIPIICSSCWLGTISRYADYTSNIGKSLPDTFRVEVPMTLYEGWFTVTGQMNHKEMRFIIDTGAQIGLAKIKTLADINAVYWGIYPTKSLNAYGQKMETVLYYPNNFDLGGLSFEKPLFKAITSDNHIQDFLSNPVLGDNLIKSLYWKFSMDDQKIVLFGKRDKPLLEREVKGYTKIEMGWSMKTNLTILPLQKPCEFIFDLGFNGEIRVDKETFAELSKRVVFKKYRYTYSDTVIDTLFLSEYVNVQWEGVEIENCRIAHAPKVNHNFIGSRFMQRLNFVLAFEDFKKRLYINSSTAFKLSESSAHFSDFGFDLDKKEKARITTIEIEGLAEVAGLQLKDIVLSIDDGAFDLNTENRHDRLVNYLRNKQMVDIKIERDGRVMNIRIATSV